jgi:hypothetical protein
MAPLHEDHWHMTPLHEDRWDIIESLHQDFLALGAQHALSLDEGIEILGLYLYTVLQAGTWLSASRGDVYPEGMIFRIMANILHGFSHVPADVDADAPPAVYDASLMVTDMSRLDPWNAKEDEK